MGVLLKCLLFIVYELISVWRVFCEKPFFWGVPGTVVLRVRGLSTDEANLYKRFMQVHLDEHPASEFGRPYVEGGFAPGMTTNVRSGISGRAQKIGLSEYLEVLAAFSEIFRLSEGLNRGYLTQTTRNGHELLGRQFDQTLYLNEGERQIRGVSIEHPLILDVGAAPYREQLNQARKGVGISRPGSMIFFNKQF